MGFMDIITNPMTTGVLKGIAGGLFGGADRDWKKKNRELAEHYAGGLSRGITQDDIMAMLPMMQKAVMPMVKGMAGRSAAKYGSRSGATLGATVNAANQAMAPQISAAMMQRLMENMQNLRSLYSGSMAAGASGNSAGLGI